MKNTTMKIVPLFIAGVLLSACGQTRYPDSLIAADSLTYVNPDSALEILDGIDKCSLDDEEMARYALVYTIAQDKSGFDVDDDSLLYIAFDYYSDRPEDTLYGKLDNYLRYESHEKSDENTTIADINVYQLREDYYQIIVTASYTWDAEYQNSQYVHYAGTTE